MLLVVAVVPPVALRWLPERFFFRVLFLLPRALLAAVRARADPTEVRLVPDRLVPRVRVWRLPAPLL